MRKLIYSISLLFAVLLLNSLTALSQCTQHSSTFDDGCKVYTKTERIRFLEAFATVEHLDSIMALKDAEIMACNRFAINLSNEITTLNDQFAEAKRAEQEEIKKKKKWRNGAIVGGIIAVLEILILIGK